MQTLRRAAVGVAVAALSLTLTACGGDDADSPGGGGDDRSPEEVLDGAATRLTDTSGVRLRLATDGDPGTDFLSSAEGVITADPAAFEGTASGTFQGIPASDVEIVSVDGTTYINLFGGFAPFDLPECVPVPAELLDPEAGVASVLDLAEGIERGESVRGGDDNDQILTPYTATVPGTAIKNILPCAPGESYAATFTIDDDGAMQDVELTGEFFAGGGDLTYEITVEEYDVEQQISKP